MVTHYSKYTKTKNGEKITVQIDGKDVDLEDAFDVFHQIFEDVDKAFLKMEDTFSYVDKNIHSKLEELKKTLAKKRPNDFEYVEDEDTDYDTFYEKVLHLYRNDRQYRIYVALILIFLIFVISIIGFSIVASNDEPNKQPPPIEMKHTQSGNTL